MSASTDDHLSIHPSITVVVLPHCIVSSGLQGCHLVHIYCQAQNAISFWIVVVNKDVQRPFYSHEYLFQTGRHDLLGHQGDLG